MKLVFYKLNKYKKTIDLDDFLKFVHKNYNVEYKQIRHGLGQYHYTIDKIRIKKSLNNESLYKVIFHELFHATGHVKRMNRNQLLKCCFGLSTIKEEGKEEMTADFTSIILLKKTGIETEYKEKINWRQAIYKLNKKEIEQCYQQAKKAIVYIINQYKIHFK